MIMIGLGSTFFEVKKYFGDLISLYETFPFLCNMSLLGTEGNLTAGGWGRWRGGGGYPSVSALLPIESTNTCLSVTVQMLIFVSDEYDHSISCITNYNLQHIVPFCIVPNQHTPGVMKEQHPTLPPPTSYLL